MASLPSEGSPPVNSEQTEARTGEAEDRTAGSLNLFEDDSSTQFSDIVSQDEHQQSYSLQDINSF